MKRPSSVQEAAGKKEGERKEGGDELLQPECSSAIRIASRFAIIFSVRRNRASVDSQGLSLRATQNALRQAQLQSRNRSLTLIWGYLRISSSQKSCAGKLRRMWRVAMAANIVQFRQLELERQSRRQLKVTKATVGNFGMRDEHWQEAMARYMGREPKKPRSETTVLIKQTLEICVSRNSTWRRGKIFGKLLSSISMDIRWRRSSSGSGSGRVKEIQIT